MCPESHINANRYCCKMAILSCLFCAYLFATPHNLFSTVSRVGQTFSLFRCATTFDVATFRENVREFNNWYHGVVLLQCGLSPFNLNLFQFNLEFGTTHRVGLCVVHPEQVKVQSVSE